VRDGRQSGTRRPGLGHVALVWELVVRESPGSKDVNTEDVEATALEAVTRQRLVKTQQAEKT
jgi:hypothetical protein